MNQSLSWLEHVPQEVLEQVAFFTATADFLGPPSSLASLLTVNRAVYSRLSVESNDHLYAEIFMAKFDIGFARHRVDSGNASVGTLSRELRKRCILLKRLRSGQIFEDDTRDVLCQTYLLMLENEGKNGRQLREYSMAEQWLKAYWLDAFKSVGSDQWLLQTTETTIATWLFWYFIAPETYEKTDPTTWNLHDIFKTYALGAPRYQMTILPWMDFLLETELSESSCCSTTYYSENYTFYPPPPAIPSILLYMTLYGHLEGSGVYKIPTPPSSVWPKSRPGEWEVEWKRCKITGNSERNALTDSFRPGSIEGVWEGLFTYTEFLAYGALLSPQSIPSQLRGTLAVRHPQKWILREYHLLGSSQDGFSSANRDATRPLSPGHPLKAYLPFHINIEETKYGLDVREPGRDEVLHYRRASVLYNKSKEGTRETDYVQDIIIKGEGHSSWGQFSLLGRVRPSDGFISLCKQYDDGDRGSWIYRGYLVGDVYGNLAGRWRDTLSPLASPGYEGCFSMSRRR